MGKGNKHKPFGKTPRKKGKDIAWNSLRRDASWMRNISKEQEKSAKNCAVFQERLPVCPICGHDTAHPFVEIYGYEYCECESCNHLFMQPPLDYGAVQCLYQGSSDSSSIQKLIYIDEDIFQNRVKQIALPKIEYCNNLISGKGLWVDVGCGTGELLTAAKKTGWKVKGFEYDAEEVSFARNHGLDIIHAYATPENLREFKDIKVMSFINVLEHINDPVGLLAGVVDILPKESYVVFEVPRHPSLSSFVNLVFPNLVYRHIVPPDHLHVFSELSAEIMLKAAGLSAVGIWEFGQGASDILSAPIVNAGIEENSFIQKILALAPEFQKVVDEQNLSDALLVVAMKR